ncbi:hypothetical protein ACPWSR_06080 [Alloiococcus sp. CFN-8]|uniref:hypothetical protein n=1 Tax=Alloiococcus sp. CFN-8 TaxID=3416081 RepID=UPI003CE6D80C
MESYFSIPMFKSELKKLRFFSPILFLVLFFIFNNQGMLSLIGSGAALDRGLAIKEYFSLSILEIVILGLVYLIAASILMMDKRAKLQDKKYQGGNRIIYFVTKGASIFTGIYLSFIACFFVKFLLYLMNSSKFINEASIGFTEIIKFFAFHMVFIFFMAAVSMAFNGFFGNIFSVVMMPIFTVYSFLLFFGTGYYLINEEYIKTRNFIAAVEGRTVYKLYKLITEDYRLSFDNSSMQVGITLLLFFLAIIFIGIALVVFKHLKVERLSNYFVYIGAEIVTVGAMVIAASLFLSLGTAMGYLLANKGMEMETAWELAYRLMFIYIFVAAFIRLLYVVIKYKPWRRLSKDIDKKREKEVSHNS